MDINNQKLIAGYSSNILGIVTLIFLLVSFTDIQSFYSPISNITFGPFAFTIVIFGLTFYVALFGYKNLESNNLKQNAIFIAIMNFLFLIQFVLDSWLTGIFGSYLTNLAILIPYMIVVAIFGISLLRNGSALLKISKIPPIKKIRNISLWLLLIGLISVVIVIITIVIDMLSNPYSALYLENPENVYEYRFQFLLYIAYFFGFLSFITFGTGLLGLVYWLYLKFKK
ncbi:hypothetical protein HYW20_01095 [Candidatus Woesearchaeota archaeon]|nr:hypothetical protein [Candidatus Woesearchaeota archaeon]